MKILPIILSKLYQVKCTVLVIHGTWVWPALKLQVMFHWQTILDVIRLYSYFDKSGQIVLQTTEPPSQPHHNPAKPNPNQPIHIRIIPYQNPELPPQSPTASLQKKQSLGRNSAHAASQRSPSPESKPPSSVAQNGLLLALV